MESKSSNKEEVVFQLARVYRELDEQDIVLSLYNQFAHTEVDK
jgi:hypothetical protein